MSERGSQQWEDEDSERACWDGEAAAEQSEFFLASSSMVVVVVAAG